MDLYYLYTAGGIQEFVTNKSAPSLQTVVSTQLECLADP